MMNQPVKNSNKFSLVKKYRSFICALSGLKTFVLEEHNSWLYILGIVLSVALGFFFHINLYEWLAQCIVTVLICSVELVNTSLENTVDLISPEYHILAKKAKDIASAAVLMAALGALVVFLTIYLPKFLALF